MHKSGQDEWMKDAREKQRNVVFPDTLRNEASGWRRLMTSKQPLTVVQTVGIGLLYLAMAVVFWGLISGRLRGSVGSSLFDRVLGGFGDWIVLFGILGAFFLLLRWRVRRALLANKHGAPGKHDLN
jgi:hypothetical protein